MAALYLHHALFAPDSPPPPSTVQGPHDRQTSSFSTVTLRTTSEYSHPTEPLLQHEGELAGSTAYLDILARQPTHPSEPRTSWHTGLSLHADPITPRERKRIREQIVRRQLRRLRWSKRIFMTLLASWAAYNAIRYFVASSLYRAAERQSVSLALGTLSVLSLALMLLSAVLSLVVTRHGRKLGWSYMCSKFQTTVEGLSSTLLLAPAATNFVFVFIWKHNADPATAVETRCRWDIDVVWSGMEKACDPPRRILWGYWLAGAIVRLVVTTFMLFTYHLLSYKYNTLTTRSSRRNRGRTHTHSVSYPSGAGMEPSLSVRSCQSSRTMMSSATLPVSVARSGRQSSQVAPEKEPPGDSGASVRSSERRTLHRFPSARVSMERFPGGDRRDVHLLSRPLQPSSEGHSSGEQAISEEDRISLGSFEEGVNSDDCNDNQARSGRNTYHSYGAYAIAPPAVSSPPERITQTTTPTLPDSDLHTFVDRFRELLEQVTQETDAGLELARSDLPGYSSDSGFPSPTSSQDTSDEVDWVPIVGSLIQRMPTIESLGSREVMSVAASSIQRGDRSIHTLSRPPTRANTLTLSEATGSQPPSRSNSLTASVVLTSPIDGQLATSELGEHISKTPGSRYGN